MRKKMYLLAGGPGGGSELGRQLQLALRECGCSSPSVAYIGTASGDDRSFMKWFERPFLKAGAAAVNLVPLVGKRADRPAAEALLRKSDLIFVSGGEVEDGMRGLDAGMRALLRQLLEEGKPFAGLSAGSIMLGRAWPHWPDEDLHPENAELFDCLGFAGPVFDTHAEAEGWPELKKAVELCGDGFTGYGIPSGEMAVIDENGRLVENDRLVRCTNRGGQAVL